MHSPLFFFSRKRCAAADTAAAARDFFFCFLRRRQKGRARIFPVVGRVRKIEGKQNKTEDDQQVHNKKRKENIKMCNN